MALGVFGFGCEDALTHLMNYVWPNVFETSPHLVQVIVLERSNNHKNIITLFITDCPFNNQFLLFTGFHGRSRRYEGLPRTHEGPLVRRSGEQN